MPHRLLTRTLFHGPSFQIEDVHCRPSHAGCGGEELVAAPGVAFVRRGVFVKHMGSRRVIAGGNHMVFFNPGEPYRVSHPDPGGDDCTSFTFDARLVREALGRGQSSGGSVSFPRDLAFDDPQAALLHHGLRRLALLGEAGPVEIEEIGMSLLGLVARTARRKAPVAGGPRRESTRGQRRRLADNVRLVLDLRFDEKLSLAGIAKAVASSPYHLARVFHGEVGVPVHRYLNRIRLRAALGRLADEQENLAGIAFETGFSSHAHLTHAFRREFGFTPSAFRRHLKISLLRQLSKNLKAGAPPSSVSSS